MEKIRLFSLFILSIFLVSSISAASLNISIPSYNSVKINSTVNLPVDTYQSGGSEINSNCTISILNTTSIFSSQTFSVPSNQKINLSGFSGYDANYIINCTASGTSSGYLSGKWEITPQATTLTLPAFSQFALIELFLAFLLVLSIFINLRIPGERIISDKDDSSLYAINNFRFAKPPIAFISYLIFLLMVFIIYMFSTIYDSTGIISPIIYQTLWLPLLIGLFVFVIMIFSKLIIEFFANKEMWKQLSLEGV